MESDRLGRLEKAISNFRADRPTMSANNADLGRMMQLIIGELAELQEAVDGKPDPGIPTQEKVIEQELADVFFLAFSLAENLGIDVYKAVMEKLAFNICRYTADKFQDGNYSEARKQVKAEEKSMRLKEQFYSEI